MLTIDPKSLPVPKLHGYLQGAIAPRPIAFVSSMDRKGNVNLSPFSFFNLFSSNPPILIFSPSRRVRDNSTKHTLQNVSEVLEVTINIVNFNMVQQTSLASCEFPKDANEFIKAGFTELPSQKVQPPRVAESPVSFECKVNEVKPLGTDGGAGNLVICEVLLMHIKDEVLNESGSIDPFKMDAVARMGNDYYCRANGEGIFIVPKPNEKMGIGFDQIPVRIRNSSVLTGNDLGQLANIQQLPDQKGIDEFRSSSDVQLALSYGEGAIHKLAQGYLKEGKLEEAWKVLLS
jgi:flavin reductase (DIM6/NTAB) family NADH-FMN oxidoreductase RutF